ncbi:MAG: LCP family protein, partial [Eubacterium sp.]|nr:LCP family protein [Eubacterium sp.]
ETGDLTLNGAQATAYSRIRSTGRGDITRTERQREVISAMIDKMKKSDLNTIDNTIDAIFPYISTSITEDDMYDLASSMLSYSLEDTVGFPIRFGYFSSDSKGSCIAPQNLQENVTALQRFLFGNNAYTPTQNLKRISDELVSETGFGSEGTVKLPSEE